MPLSEALPLLFFDSIISALIVPVHAAYIFIVMQEFSASYPLLAAATIASIGVLIGTAGNWGIGKIATSLSKAPINQTPESINTRLKKPTTSAEKIIFQWNRHGHWSLLLAGWIPMLGQAFAILGGWSGIPLKRMALPAVTGAFIYYLILLGISA